MKHRLILSTLCLLLVAAPAIAGSGAAIDVMTQNQYLGADLNPVVAAQGDPVAFNAAVLTALAQIAANDFPTRAGLLASLIAKRLPALVGLQEVFAFGCFDLAPPAPGQGCDTPAIAGAFNDHLSLTLAALATEGEAYTAAAVVENLTVPGIPVDTNFDFVPDIVVSVLDRDVILARGDVTSVSPVDYSAFCPTRVSADGCNYQIVAVAGAFVVQRGWVGVDATVDGVDYRFVNTHLEVQMPSADPLSPAIQAAQAQELIAVLGLSTPASRSLVVVGDINSSSEDPIIPGPPLTIVPPYTQFALAGYTDAWDLRPGNVPGFSCCQLSDLSNHQSIHDERIDVIFSIEAPDKVKKARVLGESVSDKSGPFGLWPADHGSVAAELQFD